MMQSNLPLGWTQTQLKNCFEQVKDKMEPMEGTSLPYIGLEHLKKGGGVEVIGKSDDLKSAKSVFKKGDVLYGKLRPYLNKHAIVDFDGVCSTDILVYRSNELCTAKLLNYFLGTASVIQYANDNSQGINLPRVSGSIMGDLSIPLPPLTEQKQIVAKLDALMEKVEAARERLEKIPELVKKFRQAVLAAAVSGRLTAEWREKNPDVEDKSKTSPWYNSLPFLGKAKILSSKRIEVNLEDVLQTKGIFDGPFGSHLKTDDYTDSGVRVIRLENIDTLYFNDSKETFISVEKYKNLIKHTVKEGDIIFSSFINEQVRACVLPKLYTTAIAKADCFCLRPNNQIILTNYLVYTLCSNQIKDKLIDKAHGMTRPRINTTQLRKTTIEVPSLIEQEEIVRQVEELFKLADSIEARYQTAKTHLDQLPQAILNKAFCGELVPQDPNDEPASMLLERILAEKVSKGKKVKESVQQELFAE